MRSLTLRTAAVAATLPMALSLTACGGGGGSATANDPHAPTSHASSSNDRSTTPQPGSAVSGPDFLKLLQSAGKKITTAKVAMTGDASGITYTMKGAMDLTGSKPAVQLTMDMGSSGPSGIEMRLVDGTMYVTEGSLTQGKYVKFDLDDPNSPLGSLSSTLDQLDPSKMIGHIGADVFRHVTYVGPDRVGRHYRGTLVTANAPKLKGLPSSATANLPKTSSYDAWFDSQGRFRKFVVTIPNLMKVTTTYTDYGTDLHITAPPASDVMEMPSGMPTT